MTARELLRRASEAQRRLRDIGIERRHLLELAEGTGGSGEGVRTASASDSRVERTAVRLADLTSRLDAEERHCAQLMQRAAALINAIPVERYRRLLRLRYLCDCQWIEIQTELRYSQNRSLYRAHRYALEEAEKVFKKNSQMYI